MLDVVVTNITEYTPWSSRSNGHHKGGTFAQISLLQDTATTFRYSFKKHDSPQEDADVDYPFEFCFFDLDTGPSNTMQETLRACGVDGYFSHGRVPARQSIRPYLCPNIDTAAFMDVSLEGGCVTATGLREGRGSDNPQEFYEVFMNTADDRRFGGASGSCDDYDTCPADAYGNMVCGSLPQRDGVWPGTDGVDCGFGISGYGRPPGQRADILNCRLRPGTLGAGVYPRSNGFDKAGSPFRWTMPKFVCMEYSAGTSSFDVTYSVTADTNGKFGRNFLFAGAGVPVE